MTTAGERVPGSTAAQTLVWDALSNLVAINATAGGERYVYDASGQRVVRIAGATATAYLGSTELTDANTASPGMVTGIRYYAFGSTTVALRDATGVSYLLGDVQGSATVLIPAGDGTGDPDAVVASRNAYTPYGVTRGSDNLTTDRGWLGQVEDGSSGLTYLNARYHDPATARFLSPDPLMDPADPRTLDPYRYADNNPVLYTDASGLSPACGGMTGAKQAACYKQYADAQKSNVAAKVKDTAIQNLNKNSAKNGSGKTFSKKDVPGATKKSSHPRPHAANPKGMHGGGCAKNLKTCVNPGGGLNGPPARVFADTWRSTRLGLNVANPINAVAGGGAAALSMTHGGRCQFDTSELMWACYGSRYGVMPGGSGTTYGAVFISADTKAVVIARDERKQTRTISHEAKHSDQAALMGVLGTAVVLGADAAVKYMKESNYEPPPNYSCNVIERWAGYQDGGYGTECK